MIDDTHNPTLKSWIETANATDIDFPIQNLPFGVFRPRASRDAFRIGVAIGNQILDLEHCRRAGLLETLSDGVLAAVSAGELNPLMALGSTAASSLRTRVSSLLRVGAPARGELLVSMEDAEMALPATIGDYSDFYASIFHATNVGSLFRPNNPLLPNYKYVPIAYHGRSSSIVVSGTAICRPWGQFKGADDAFPTFRPSERLDYEAEIAALVGVGNDLGETVELNSAEEHIFGLCLLNYWSARDIQAWEYQPLGPFLAKDFATSLSPWVITLQALAPFRTPAWPRPKDDPPPLPHLSSPANEAEGGFDVTIEVHVRSLRMRELGLPPQRLSGGSLRDMYWTMAQMVTHHTSNGCNLRPGDVIGSGTVSGRDEGSRGCLLEITKGGTHPITLPSGESRLFLADGDEVMLRVFCERAGFARIGFGECVCLVQSAPRPPS